MHRTRSVLAAAAAAALLPLSASAAGIGAYAGVMDTELLGESIIYGAQLELDFAPCVSVLVRGGYAGDFDDLSISADQNLPTVRGDGLELVPVELGVLIRPPEIFGFLGIYAGGGAGWYYVPGFDVKAGERLLAETEEITDLVGWWALAGVEAGVPNFHVFAELKYARAIEDDLEVEFHNVRNLGNLSIDMDLTGLAVLVGVRVSW